MADKFSPLLGDMEIAHFMQHYWQKKPCILRQVLTKQQCQLFSVDELAGFALDEAIESRLIRGKPGIDSPDKIKVTHGAFSEDTLSNLPEQDWTLLLQSVDLWEEQYQTFLNWVNFLPRWRLDDIMVSIAAPGGGVGPHRDQYDVFLIQSQGERRWQVSPPSSEADDYSVTDLVQVTPFAGEIDEIFKAGDVLYIPPGWLHWGVANSLAVTCSIGFRAPSAKDLLISVSDQLVELPKDSERYADQWRKPSTKMNITSDDIKQVRKNLELLLNDDALLAEALGKQATQSKFLAEEFAPEIEQNAALQISENDSVKLHPASRMSYFVSESGALQIYLNGETFLFKMDDSFQQLLDKLCLHQPIDTAELDAKNPLHREILKFLESQIIEGCVCVI